MGDECCEDIKSLYGTLISYLRIIDETALRIPFLKFFLWHLKRNWQEWCGKCVTYLIDKKMAIDDVKCFDQFTNFKKFTSNLIGKLELICCLGMRSGQNTLNNLQSLNVTQCC